MVNKTKTFFYYMSNPGILLFCRYAETNPAESTTDSTLVKDAKAFSNVAFGGISPIHVGVIETVQSTSTTEINASSAASTNASK